MEKEFVPYELASRMKQLGFDEPCFAWYDGRYTSSINKDYCKNSEEWLNTIHCAAPLFQQAFRWFREKYNVFSYIESFTNGDNIEMYEFIIYSNQVNTLDEKDCYTYEEAEYDCLDKLIELTFKSNQ